VTTSAAVASLYGATVDESRQREAFLAGEVPVAVYGLGKMGLPLAAVYADCCGNVRGADPDPAVVETVNAGACHVDREPGLPELVADVVDRGALSATTDPCRAAREATVHVVIVPTLVDERHDPDLRALESVGRDIATGLAPGDLVVVESTTPPRTARDAFLPLLEAESGLSLGEFGVAVCPERTSSGRALADVRGSHPKVVGGVDAESARAAGLVYGELVDNEVYTVSDATTAEAVKVFEGVYRDVNIALANELARFTDTLEVDVSEAIDVANTQPYCDIHSPGPGVGGHCIPYYPYFLLRPFEMPAPLLETARDVNDAMPSYVVDRLAAELEAVGRSLADATVLVLGVTYRAGVAETRAAPARGVCASLSARGASVLAVDPLVGADSDEWASFEATPVELDAVADTDADAAVLVTAHEEFGGVDWTAFDAPLVVVDTRRVLDLGETDHRVYAIGRGHID
jgi:UDP-N-acetyl-D-mannosaminuronic acid dehydrogenase